MRRRDLPGDSEDDGVGDLASGTGDEDALGFVVEGGSGHGSGGDGHDGAVNLVEVGDHSFAYLCLEGSSDLEV